MVTIFARKITDNLTSLVKKIDGVVGENKKNRMAAFVVLLSDEPDSAEKKLKRLAKKQGIKNTPLTIFEGVSGPKNYKVAKDAEVTVLMWINKEVKVNHAFAKGGLDEEAIKKIVEDTSKILN